VSGLLVTPRTLPDAPADCSAVLVGSWIGLGSRDFARRPVSIAGRAAVPLGELCEVTGEPNGSVRFVGDWGRATRLGAGLTEGTVLVEGNVGDEVGLGMAGGSIQVRGNAGTRAGAAAVEARRGMTGGELVVHGSVGREAGALMRRGLLVAGNVGDHAAVGMIAGTILAFGTIGPTPGLWSKRGSVVALGEVPVPSTYRYACTYQPVHVRLMLTRLKARYDMPVEERHLTGFYRRYSGDLAELGKGEILAWIP